MMMMMTMLIMITKTTLENSDSWQIRPQKAKQILISIQEAAAVFNTLMGRLGHKKFIAQVLMLMLMLTSFVLMMVDI